MLYLPAMMSGLALLLTAPAPMTSNLLWRPDAVAQNIQQLSLLPLTEIKFCPQCQEWKPRVKFFKSNTKDGRSPRCRNCTDPPEKQRARDRARYRKPGRNKEVRDRVRLWYANNTERVKRDNHRRYEADKENRSVQGKQYYAANKERINARNKDYRERTRPAHVKKCVHRDWTPEETRERKRNWRLASPERYREADRARYVRDKAKRLLAVKAYHKAHPEVKQLIEARRRARIKGSNGKLTKAQWDQLCAKYDYKCLRCHERQKLSVDHVVPLSKGGEHTLANVQPLCVQCNRIKHMRSTDYRT